MVKQTTKKSNKTKTHAKNSTTEKTTHSKHKKQNNGMSWTLGIIAGIFIILFILAVTTNVFHSSTKKSAEQVKTETLSMINNLLQGQATANITNITFNKETDMYELSISINDKAQPTAYVSGNGELFFPQALPVTTKEATATNTQTPKAQPAAKNVPKTDKPKVELFVMAYCPYGLQMEKAYVPVMELLGSKADMSIKWVNYAMHGKKEVDENLRQDCIEKEFSDQYLTYLRCFVDSNDYQSCLEKTTIDSTKLDTCIAKEDKEFGITSDYNDKSTWSGGQFPRFAIDDALNQKYGVRGSPTLVINGVQASVSRSAETVKQAVCNAFNNPPAECDTALSTAQEQPGAGPIGAGAGSATPAAANCGA